jgi:hypothetical protein
MANPQLHEASSMVRPVGLSRSDPFAVTRAMSPAMPAPALAGLEELRHVDDGYPLALSSVSAA